MNSIILKHVVYDAILLLLNFELGEMLLKYFMPTVKSNMYLLVFNVFL